MFVISSRYSFNSSTRCSGSICSVISVKPLMSDMKTVRYFLLDPRATSVSPVKIDSASCGDTYLLSRSTRCNSSTLRSTVSWRLALSDSRSVYRLPS